MANWPPCARPARRAFLVFRFRAKGARADLADDGARRRWFTLASVLIQALQLAAPALGFGYSQICGALDRQAAGSLIAGLEAYRAGAGSYFPDSAPDGTYQTNLDFLVPRYVASIPARACATAIFGRLDPAYAMDDTWSLYDCANSPSRDVLLTVPFMVSDTRQTYNLRTKSWSSGDSLDGYCRNLP